MLNFNFLEKCLWTFFLLHFDFSIKMFLMLYSIKWLNFIVWFSLLQEIFGNMCFAIVCFPGCNFINFEVKLIFLFKPFFCVTEKSRQKFIIILRTKRDFKVHWKAFLIIFEGISAARNYLRPESAPLICQIGISFLYFNFRTILSHRVLLFSICRNSRPEVFCRKGVLRNFAKFTVKHLFQNLFFNKIAGLQLY